ncbi:MAG: hypothetical protein B6229_06090 [Spirochaetaceae bacterium 4572_7]|nr:MAG: hypothetical protein B6229_06090 [Spirochaetaceae bacterium 4572_7]
MGIKTVKYKANSIIYFKGDVADRVYILKKGSIVTKANDLKTNEDLLSMIKVGEFIGVKNVISRQPYSETVSTLTDSELVVFYKDDFEKFILSNSRIMMQTLVVFSNQLRRIHRDIKELNNSKEHTHSSSDIEKDLLDLGKYFLKQKKIESSNYCLEKYLEVYPRGKYVDECHSYLDTGSFVEKEEKEQILEESSLNFQEGENYLDENNYAKAQECFQKVIDAKDGYRLTDTLFYNGVSLYKLNEYKKCIHNFSDFFSKHKDYDKILDVMFYVGSSYMGLGDGAQGSKFLKQVVKKGEGSPIAKAAHKELKG